MINNQEMLAVVDSNNLPIEPKIRSIVHKEGLWHRTTGIWVFNKHHQILCQKRSLQKDTKPGFWEAFFGGHMSPQETYIQNAVNEVNEELGIVIKQSELIPYKILQSDKTSHKEFQAVYALRLQKPSVSFHFEKEEIDEIRWLPFAKVKKILLEKNELQWVKKPWDEAVLLWLLSL